TRVDNYSAAIVQLDTFEKVCDRVNTNTDQDHIRFNALAIGEPDCLNIVCPLEPVNNRAEFETNTVALVYAPEQRTDFRTERGLERLLRRSNDSYFKATFAQAVSRLHSDEARSNNDCAARTRRCLNNRVSIRKTTQHANVLQIRTGYVETNGRAASRNKQRVVLHRLISIEGDCLAARVNAGDFLAQNKLNVVILEELVRTKRHPLRLRVSMQVIFTQIGPIVRRA